jgi:hypothetical protein
MIGSLHVVVIRVSHQATVKPLPSAPVHRILLIPYKNNTESEQAIHQK